MLRLPEEVALGHVRGVDQRVPGAQVAAQGVLLHLVADDPAARVEHRETGPDLVGETEQVELRTQPAVVALLRLGEAIEVGVHRLGALPRRAVDALEAGVLLIAAPVRRGGTGEGERGDELGGGCVGTPAQIRPDHFTRARVEVVVRGQCAGPDLHDLRVLEGLGAPGVAGVRPSLVLHQLELVRLTGELGAGLVQRGVLAPGETLARFDDLLHPLLEVLEVLGSERLGHVEVVVEAVLDRRADPELRLGELVLDGLRQHVGAGVSDHGPAVLGVRADEFDLGVRLGRPRQVAQRAIGVAHHHDGLRAAPRLQLPLGEDLARRFSRRDDSGGHGARIRCVDVGFRHAVLGHGGRSPRQWMTGDRGSPVTAHQLR